MTTEEKAKAYDEALETAKRIISNNCTEVEKLCLKCIFPQLKESEDERIIEEIKFAVIQMPSEREDTRQRCLTWLEKQKEQKDFPTTDKETEEFLATHKSIEVPEKYKTADWLFEKQKEQKPAEWSEEDEKIITRLIDYFESFRIVGVTTKWEGLDIQEVITLLKSLRPVSKESLQPHWKPSEAQMEALLNAEKYLNAGLQYGSAKRIAELIEQFEKL